jgi:Kef-type K+ transport system membrane component KefB
MHQLLPDIGVAILAATVMGLVAHWSRQPIILGYLLAGAAIGPKVGLGLVHDQGSIEVISEIGLILLLFIIGLEMNLKALLSSGRQLLVAGFGQFPLCALIGIGLFALMGYGLSGTASDGLYLALMCGLSSTAVVVKLLYDKGELDTLPGRMTLGVLVIQDVYAIFILAFQPNFASPSAGPILKALGGTVLLLAMGFLWSKYILRRVFSSIAKAPEMVVAVSIGWCAAVAAAAAGLGLSKEMGALVAGLSVAAFPYSIHVTAKTLPLRDFFLTLFFVSLGMQITAPRWNMVGLIALLVAFVVVTRFATVYPLISMAGGGRRTAFISSLNLAQISEFSLVIASLGVFYKHIDESTVAVTIYAMAATAVLSSYAIRYNHPLYLSFERLMARLGRGTAIVAGASGNGHADSNGHERRPMVLLGIHRTARTLIDALAERAPGALTKLRVVDFNPETLRELAARGVAGTFGDLSSHDTLEHAHLHDCELIVSTIPDSLLKGTDNQTLVKVCRSLAPRAAVVATADDARHERVLRAEGAEFVLNPHTLAAEQLVALVGRMQATGDGDAAGNGTGNGNGHHGAPPGRPVTPDLAGVR